MSKDHNLTDTIPISPSKPGTKINLWMVFAVLVFLGAGAWFVSGVADDPPTSVDEVTEIVP